MTPFFHSFLSQHHQKILPVFIVLCIIGVSANFFPVTAVNPSDNIIGEIIPPESVDTFNNQSGGEIGILFFLSRVVQFFIVIAGIVSLFNFITAGAIFITSAGDTSAYGKVKDKLVYGVIGMVVIASAYTLVGLIGLVFFGDASAILNPELYVIEPPPPPPRPGN